MTKNPFNVLTSFQMAVLDVLRTEPILKDFYLTGGTALAGFFLGHRLSEDLDFFTELESGVARIPPVVQKVSRILKAEVSLGRRFETFFECTLISPAGERVEMDFALDMPGRLKPTKIHKHWGIQLDNRIDIACNKLSALYDRSEPKDFVDIYFICKKYLPMPKLLKVSHRKYPAMDDYGLAMAFLKIRDITFWPKMLLPFDPKAMQHFFVQQAKLLAKEFWR